MPIFNTNTPLAPLTTFEIGGSADFFIEVATEDTLINAIEFSLEKNVPFYLLSGGSNILFPDEGFRGLIIKIVSKGMYYEGSILHAEAGENLLGLIQKSSKFGLGGWSNLAGIPGTLGGAIRGNAGAFGTEIKDIVVSIEALNSRSRERKTFSNEECSFRYRESYFKRNPEWVVLRAELRLIPAENEIIEKEIKNTIEERERRHLQNVRAAGSFFMNPIAPKLIQERFETEKNTKSREGRVPAGWLIEKVGMKGARLGGAIASLQHPNYLVNDSGSATARDVIALAARIKTAVQEHFGIELREEAAIVK